MNFRSAKRPSITIENPESLFRDLRNRTVQGLLSQQADMLREYMQYIDKEDVAIQMPTGSGKTLVGLLIAEWRRKSKKERVVYLCPTNQLVNQVVEQAKDKYGINAIAFTGAKRDFDPSLQTEYLSAESIAVTSYSHLFNTSPFFNNAETIILDDAHAAENYISDFWSLNVFKANKEHRVCFEVVTSILKSILPVTEFTRFAGDFDETADQLWVNKLPTPALITIQTELLEALDTHCRPVADLCFKWQVLREHLIACQFYYSSDRLLIRPIVPMTDTHAPFASAKHRVYMSATLGEGGELERLIGRKVLTKIPAPSGWEKQGIGRRLFIFPIRSFNDETSTQLMLEMINISKRALVLTPSDKQSNTLRVMVETSLPDFTVFNAKDIEDTKRVFVNSDRAVAIVANRYDGLDLVGQECRLLIAYGLPKATNLQEQFLITRLGASVLYNDRIRTRIIQATGRCTRSANDYAVVVIFGDQLSKYFLQHEDREFLHPELQAEIIFGIEESKNRSKEDMLSLLTCFLEQNDEWKKGDEIIVETREELVQKQLPCVEQFVNSVKHEIGYQYALWYSDYPKALEEARHVLTSLEGPQELRGYRAYWLYLAGNAAWLSHLQGIQEMDIISRDYYTRASKAAVGIPWLHELSRLNLLQKDTDIDDYVELDITIERLERELENLGITHERKFEILVKEILDGLSQTDAKLFENAQVLLGRFLGFAADNSSEDSAPDPWWILSENEGIVFEDYTDCKIDAVISTEKVRQAASHSAWLSANTDTKNVSFDTIIVTPSTKLGNGALPTATGLYYWEMSEFVKWAKGAIAIIRDLRRTFTGAGNLVWRAEAKEAYLKGNLDPNALLSMIRKSALNSLSMSARK